MGKILGPSFKADDMGDIISKIIDVFVEKRQDEELFIDCVRRVGLDPFKERVYAKSN